MNFALAAVEKKMHLNNLLNIWMISYWIKLFLAHFTVARQHTTLLLILKQAAPLQAIILAQINKNLKKDNKIYMRREREKVERGNKNAMSISFIIIHMDKKKIKFLFIYFLTVKMDFLICTLSSSDYDKTKTHIINLI